jgi:hypothetical protein
MRLRHELGATAEFLFEVKVEVEVEAG